MHEKSKNPPQTQYSQEDGEDVGAIVVGDNVGPTDGDVEGSDVGCLVGCCVGDLEANTGGSEGW